MTFLCVIFTGIMTLTLTLYPNQKEKSGSFAALKIYTSVVHFFGWLMPGNSVLFGFVMIPLRSLVCFIFMFHDTLNKCNYYYC